MVFFPQVKQFRVIVSEFAEFDSNSNDRKSRNGLSGNERRSSFVVPARSVSAFRVLLPYKAPPKALVFSGELTSCTEFKV